MTTFESLRLAELLISRLCHDLIAPIGAINTGLELFQETSKEHHTETNEILNLILQSATAASARLSFFRAAFGSSKRLSHEEIKELLENYFGKQKLEFHWENSLPKNPLFEEWGRLLLNSILWMSDCAPRGGALHISFHEQETPLLSLRLKAEPLIIHHGTVEALENQVSFQDLTPRTVPCYLVNYILKEKGGKLTIHHTPASSEISLEIKGTG